MAIGNHRRRLCVPWAAGLLLGISLAASSAHAAEPSLTATVGGKPWSATDISALISITRGDPATLTIYGYRTEGLFSFVLFLPAAGDYVHDFMFRPSQSAKASTGMFKRLTGKGDGVGPSYRFTRGHLTIVGFDAASGTVSGTFSGTVSDNAGGSITVENGAFSDLSIQPLPDVN